jgi:hypothetical protein
MSLPLLANCGFCTASDHGRFKSLCCIPYFIIAMLVLLCFIGALTLMAVFQFNSFNEIHVGTGVSYTVINSVLIALGSIVTIALLANVYTLLRAIAHLAVPTRKQVGMHSFSDLWQCVIYNYFRCPQCALR